MKNMEYLKGLPIAVLGSGAVGKTLAADCKLGGCKDVRLYGSAEFFDSSLNGIDKTGILLDGIQRNRDCFERSGRAFVDKITTDMSVAVKGAGIICISTVAWRHDLFFDKLIPCLEDGQVIMFFPDNWGSLLLRKMMNDRGCNKDVIIGGWSSAPYGTRIESINGYRFPHVGVKYRAITLRGAAFPASDSDEFIEASRYLPAMDAITNGDGPQKGDTILDIEFANVNPVIHVPASILGVSTMENWGVIFGGHDKNTYSMYSHGLCKSICEVQYKFYNEEISLAKKLRVGCPEYKYEMFFSRRSVLTQEYMGINKDGNDNVIFPLDQPSNEGNTGPNSVNHRYITEDIPVNCKLYHDLGCAYGVKTPIIDSMIVLGGAFHGVDYLRESRYSLDYIGISNMSIEELNHYLREK